MPCANKKVQDWLDTESTCDKFCLKTVMGTTTVIITVLCVMCASRLFRDQTALEKTVGKLSRHNPLQTTSTSQ